MSEVEKIGSWEIPATNNYKIIALFGKSGAGKNTLQRWMADNLSDINEIISCTTRPKRENEIDGLNYHFITEDDFIDKINKNLMLETASFRGWFYGTSLNELDKSKINVGVFNIQGIISLLENPNLQVLPVYIKAYDMTRLKRCLGRERNPDCKEICRRFLTDEEDFQNIPFKYAIFENNSENKGFYNIQSVSEVAEFIKGQS